MIARPAAAGLFLWLNRRPKYYIMWLSVFVCTKSGILPYIKRRGKHEHCHQTERSGSRLRPVQDPDRHRKGDAGDPARGGHRIVRGHRAPHRAAGGAIAAERTRGRSAGPGGGLPDGQRTQGRRQEVHHLPLRKREDPGGPQRGFRPAHQRGFHQPV